VESSIDGWCGVVAAKCCSPIATMVGGGERQGAGSKESNQAISWDGAV
jgi:hypothetical protein